MITVRPKTLPEPNPLPKICSLEIGTPFRLGTDEFSGKIWILHDMSRGECWAGSWGRIDSRWFPSHTRVHLVDLDITWSYKETP